MSVISPFVIDGIKCIADTSLISFNETVGNFCCGIVFSCIMVTGLWRLWSNTGIVILKYERNKPLEAWPKEHRMLQ